MTGIPYVGNASGQARKVQEIYVGNGSSQARKAQAVYVGNSSGIAVKVWPTTLLPTNYQEVEYITRSTSSFDHDIGTYIDLNLIPDSHTEIITCLGNFKAYRNYGNPDRMMFGTAVWNYVPKLGYALHGAFGLYCFYSNSGLSVYSIFKGEEEDADGIDYLGDRCGNFSNTDIVLFDLNRNNGQTWIRKNNDDEELIATSTEVFGSYNGNTIGIFGKENAIDTPSGGGISPGIHPLDSIFNFNFYYCAIYYKPNTLLMECYPCYRKSDFKTGVFDVVSNNFYPAIDGDFYCGPDCDELPDYLNI